MRKNKTGWIYVAVISLIPILSVFSFGLIKTTNQQSMELIKITKEIHKDLEAEKILLFLLNQMDPSSNNIHFPTFEGLDVEVINEESKLNINRLVLPGGQKDELWLIVFERLSASLNLGFFNWEDIISKRSKKYSKWSSLGDVFSFNELRKKDTMAQIDKVFTVHSNGKVNVNTASKIILSALSQNWVNSDFDWIIKNRPFDDINQIHEGPIPRSVWEDIKNRITVNGEFYQISIASQDAQDKSKLRVIVQNKKKLWKIIQWFH